MSELFDAEMDCVMKSLGYCCSRRYVFSPQTLCCYGKSNGTQLCNISRDNVYYNYEDRYLACYT